jgi:DNA end-binding protein Ku
MRAIWNGEIAFGLVAVPVKLYSATKNLTPKFHLIHTECGTRIQMKRWCPKEEVEVPWEEIEKGYEVSKGRYAKFSKDEIAELEGEDAAEGIDIAEFVDPGEVDLALIEKSYWVGPAGKTTRSYQLLRDAMEKSGKYALARVKIRTRTRLALLRPRDGRFSLDMIRFGDELVPANDVDVPASRAKKTGKELDLALDLIDRMTGHFDPEKHPDDYRKAVLRAVELKAEHEELAEDVEIDEEKKTRGRGKVIDLADMLSRSLSGTKKKHRAVTKRAPAHAARTARAKKGTRTRASKKTTKRKAARR